MNPPASAFDCFVSERSGDLRRITRCTKGRQQLNDVINQCWLMARQLGQDETFADLQNFSFQEHLLARLYNFFVKHTEPILPRSISLDSGTDHDDSSSDNHRLAYVLTSNTPDPLSELLDMEETVAAIQLENSANIHCSLAGAYIRLLKHFHAWQKVAEHLNTSISTTCKHYRRAAFLARHQHHLLFLMPADFLPGPWRRSRSVQTVRQLMFEFSYQLSFSVINPDFDLR